jgi:coatomer subunit beta
MIQSECPAVSYEAAWTLVSLSTAPTAVRACAQAFVTLLNSNSDNNIKLIILDRLNDLKKHHLKVIQEILMDILRALSSPNIDICKKTLLLTIDMVSPRNIEEVIQVLKREVIRTQETELEHGEEYKTLLIQTIHKCALRFAEVADNVVLVLLDFLPGEGGYDVIQCVKSIVEQYPSFRSSVIRKVIDNFDEISTSDGLRAALWLLAEYADVAIDSSNNSETMISDAFDAVMGLLGEAPYLTPEKALEESSNNAPSTTVITKNIVLADGTYATVTSTETVGGAVQESLPHLRKLVIGGDLLLGTVVSVTLTKLALKATHDPTLQGVVSNRLVTSAVLVAVGIGRVAETKTKGKHGVHADCIDRLTSCCRILLDPGVRERLAPTWLTAGKDAFMTIVTNQKLAKSKASEANKKSSASQADDLIQFRQLRAQAVQGGIEVDLMDADDISRATGTDASQNDSNKLPHVHQLTGYSDPVYVEASITVHDYDIILDILVINRTPNTLTNLTLELATMGDLKLVERPQSHTIGPLDERKLRANIKVSSTETGHIFGTIVFDNSSTAQKTYVNLSDIQLNIMDYIRPAECRSEDFRSMWAEFEWENKVAINTNITDLREFLNHLLANTNMTCLTPIDDGNVVCFTLSSPHSNSFVSSSLFAECCLLCV